MSAAFLATGCEFREAHSYRYRLVVEVDTPQGVRTGAEVWETKATEGTGIPDTARRLRSRGQAVAVDLPAGTLFAVLRDSDRGVDYPDYVVPVHLEAHPQADVDIGAGWKQSMADIKRAKPTFELYSDEYPTLVRFRNPANSSTVQEVDPANLSASFGPGYQLRRIYISITDDPLPSGTIRGRLKWLSPEKDSGKRMVREWARTDHSLPVMLSHSDFVRGL